ncbi:hypothetical protein [Bradyrhizobium commune]|uniref:DUF4345 domain-containing protein n=1 Tax=Bradyrhizobium commune TaxID=83627 RepID=A0A7S9D2F6_9BRAD|nr:hypothetical protein [Bradyrhizobium commune]QPF89921.1 hypothetical protein IC761_25925 [Bradyrhizobium commune]
MELRSDNKIRYARWIFLAAGTYGLLVLVPGFFFENELAVRAPPAITHPEFYYGFGGAVTLWQIVFFFIATDPIRFRPLVALSILEKFSFFSVCLVLFLTGRLAPGAPLLGGAIDALWMVLFAIAWIRIRDRS